MEANAVLIVLNVILGTGFVGFCIREVVKFFINKKLKEKEEQEQTNKKNAQILKEEQLMKKIDDRIELSVDPKLENLEKMILDMSNDFKEFAKEVRAHNKRSDEAQRALLKDRLHELFRICDSRGYTGPYERINFENMYNNYRALNGNGEMVSINEKFMNLPLEPQKAKEDKEA